MRRFDVIKPGVALCTTTCVCIGFGALHGIMQIRWRRETAKTVLTLMTASHASPIHEKHDEMLIVKTNDSL